MQLFSCANLVTIIFSQGKIPRVLWLVAGRTAVVTKDLCPV